MTEFVRLRDLVKPGSQDIAKTLLHLSEILADSGERARVQFRFVGGQKSMSWCLELGEGRASLSEEAGDADLEIVTRRETWWEIAKGSLSPLDAMIGGDLRIRGDAELGKRLLRHAAAGPGRVDPC